jgi:thymidylate synthase (FAD)
MEVTYIDSLGDDVMVVNAARVSFNKESQYEIVGDSSGDDWSFKLPDQDVKLLSYLAKHQHWTPFAHPQITLRVKAPVFVRTQLFKHKVGFTENEVSRRYVDDEPEFFFPEGFRPRPTDGAKQGSAEGFVPRNDAIKVEYEWFIEQALEMYEQLIEDGVAPEQARMVLPQSMYTEWFWTGSLAAYARMCRQRLDSHAQQETREVAQMISDIIEPIFPESWKVLMANVKS